MNNNGCCPCKLQHHLLFYAPKVFCCEHAICSREVQQSVTFLYHINVQKSIKTTLVEHEKTTTFARFCSIISNNSTISRMCTTKEKVHLIFYHIITNHTCRRARHGSTMKVESSWIV